MCIDKEVYSISVNSGRLQRNSIWSISHLLTKLKQILHSNRLFRRQEAQHNRWSHPDATLIQMIKEYLFTYLRGQMQRSLSTGWRFVHGFGIKFQNYWKLGRISLLAGWRCTANLKKGHWNAKQHCSWQRISSYMHGNHANTNKFVGRNL